MKIKMEIDYDKVNDCGYIRLKMPESGVKSRMSKNGRYVFDYDDADILVGIEFFSLSDIVTILVDNIEIE